MALSEREVRQLNAQLPPTSSVMASAVAKLLLSSPNPRLNRSDPNTIFASFPHINSNDWSDTGVVGALVLVVDRAKDCVLLQIYDLEGMMKRFEFEIYYDMDYLSLDPSFHAFEMEECVAGLSFSNREVARKFLAKVRAMTPDSSHARSTPTPSLASEGSKKRGGLFGGSAAAKQKPVQISSVMTVTHHQHVGMQADGTLDLDTVSPEWRAIFKQAGVKKRDLKNPETSRALIQSIAQSGYSLAVAPGQYVQASPLKPKEGPLAERRVPQNNYQQAQPGMGSSNPARQTKLYTVQELQKHYTKDQVDMYVAYQLQLAEYEKAQKKYLEDLAAYEKQVALGKWEKDNQGFLQEQEKVKRMSKDPRYTNPPPLPPRKKKTGDSDLRPRFETAPAASAPKSMAYVPPSMVSHSLPNPPANKPLPSPRGNGQKPQQQYRNQHMMSDDEDEKEIPERPLSPEAPAPPPLPPLKNGDNPVLGLQEQLQLQAGRLKAAPDRPESRMMLKAVAGSQIDLREIVNQAKRTDATKQEDILGTLITALAVRRAQLGEEDDSEDDWSD